MNRVAQYLSGRLHEREDAGNLRRLTTQRAGVDFFSNDYLGFVTTGLLADLMHSGRGDHFTPGSTGSRLLSGNSAFAGELEERIATFHGAEAALLFNSGYDANMGLLSSVASRHTTILSDELCHASLIDGIRLSQCAQKYRFRHNDLEDLERKLGKYGLQEPVIVVVESVYSMDGDMAPLEAIAGLCEKYEAQLVVDEAHATGVFGEKGQGLVCALGLGAKVFARVHTYGKAMGCHGAVVVGSDLLKQYLVNFARSFIYTTALPGHSLHAIHCAYQHLASHQFDNRPLHNLISYFREKAGESECNWMDSRSPIQALMAGNNEQCKRTAQKLQAAGLQVNPILHPTVPAGTERLRVCLHSFNTTAQVDVLHECLRELNT